jgi:hypothetical protein
LDSVEDNQNRWNKFGQNDGKIHQSKGIPHTVSRKKPRKPLIILLN